MKDFITLLFFFVFTSTFSQTVQPCVVMEYNERLKKTPLGNVVLKVKNAGAALSNGKGECTLRFRTLKPGDRVEYVQGSITREGYEVFNKEALEQWTLAGGQKPFRIDMVKSSRFKTIRDSYEAAMSKNYRVQRDQEQARLKKEREANRISKEQYERRLQEIQDEYDQQLEDIAAQVDRFARIDLSEMTDIDVRALEMLQQGNIEEAIRIKESQDILAIRAKLIEETKEIEKQELIEELTRRDRRAHINDSLRAQMRISARTQLDLYLAMGTAEYRAKADSFYHALAIQDTTDIKMLKEYFSYASVRKNVDGMASAGRIIVNYYYKEYLQTPQERDFYHSFSDFEDALGYLEQHKISKKYLSYDNDSEMFEISVSKTKREAALYALMYMETLYLELDKAGASEMGFRYILMMKEMFEKDESLKQYEEKNDRYQSWSPAAYYAKLCYYLSGYYIEQQDYSQALQYGARACSVYEQFPRGTFDDDYYFARDRVQNIYKAQGNYHGCIDFFSYRVDAFQKEWEDQSSTKMQLESLVDINKYPSLLAGLEDLYVKDINYSKDAPDFRNMGDIGMYDAHWMEVHYNRQQQFNALFNATYRYGDALYDMMQVETVFNHYNEAVSWGEKATGIFEELAKLDERKQPQLSNMYFMLSNLHSSIKDYTSAMEYAQKALLYYETEQGKKFYLYWRRPDQIRSLIREYRKKDSNTTDFSYFFERAKRLKVQNYSLATDADLCALGDAYYDLYILHSWIGQTDESIKYGDEAAKCYINMKLGNSRAANMYRELQELCFNSSKMEEVLKYGTESLKYYKGLGKYGYENEANGYIIGEIHYKNALALFNLGRGSKDILQELDKSIEIYETNLEVNPREFVLEELLRSSVLRFSILNEGKRYDNLLESSDNDSKIVESEQETVLIGASLVSEQIKRLFPESSDEYRVALAGAFKNVMSLYADRGNLTEYERYLDLALDAYMTLYQQHQWKYRSIVIDLRNRKVWRLSVNGESDKAIKLAEATCAMDKSNVQSKIHLAYCYNELSIEKANAANFDNAYICIDKAIMMFPDNPDFYDSKGEILLMQGRNDEALEMWQKVLELKPNFLDDYPDGTNLSNGLKKLGLIE